MSVHGESAQPAVLLAVDVQNAVMEGIESGAATIATIGQLVEAARRSGAPVVWVQHEEEDLPRGSDAWQIVPELRPAASERRVMKRHRSSFAGTGLVDALRAQGIGAIVLTGAQSAFCIDMAGKHALAEGFDVTLVSDGHCNGEMQTDAGALTDAQVRGLVNRTWATLRHPGRSVGVMPAVDVRWPGRGR